MEYLNEFNTSTAYIVTIHGILSLSDSLDIGDFVFSRDQLNDGTDITIITGTFNNQDKLAELLNLIYEQQLTIISVRKLSN